MLLSPDQSVSQVSARGELQLVIVFTVLFPVLCLRAQLPSSPQEAGYTVSFPRQEYEAIDSISTCPHLVFPIFHVLRVGTSHSQHSLFPGQTL